MSNETSPALRYGVDQLAVRRNRIFGWGWVTHAVRAVNALSLVVRGDGWDVRLPVNAGLVRDDVHAAFPGLLNARVSGFVVSGYLPRTPARAAALELTFDDGGHASIDVTGSLETFSRNQRKLRELRWLARAVLRRLGQRDLRGIIHRATSQDYGAPSLEARGAVERLLQRLRGAGPVGLVFDHSMGGGANVFRRQLIDEWVACGRTVLLCTYNLPTLDYRLHVLGPGAPEQRYRLESFTALEAVLDRAGVDELFLNSPVSFDEPLVFAGWLAAMRARHARLRLTVAVHDYFVACPSFVLLDADGSYCGIPAIGECAKCLKRHDASYVKLSPPTEIGPWRALWGRCLAAADEVRCFSQSTRRLLLRAYPALAADRLTVVPHRVDFAPAWMPRVDHAQPLVIGVVGHISVQKGALVVRQIVEAIDRARRDIRVVVIGTLDGAPVSPRLMVTGAYRRDELPRLIEAHRINIGFFPSICPETFSYVVEELLLLRLPLVAFDLGAPGERLRQHPGARLVSEASAPAALSALVAFHEHLASTQAAMA